MCGTNKKDIVPLSVNENGNNNDEVVIDEVVTDEVENETETTVITEEQVTEKPKRTRAKKGSQSKK